MHLAGSVHRSGCFRHGRRAAHGPSCVRGGHKLRDDRGENVSDQSCEVVDGWLVLTFSGENNIKAPMARLTKFQAYLGRLTWALPSRQVSMKASNTDTNGAPESSSCHVKMRTASASAQTCASLLHTGYMAAHSSGGSGPPRPGDLAVSLCLESCSTIS